MNPRLAMVLAAAHILSACAQPGTFPSLAPRAVETEAPRETPAPAPTDPALVAKVAELRAEAEAGQSAFLVEVGAARSAVAKAGGAGSESWTLAQQAVSRLEAARAQTATALTELDRLSIARANQPTHAADYEALMEATEAARALFAEQKAELDRLASALSGS